MKPLTYTAAAMVITYGIIAGDWSAVVSALVVPYAIYHWTPQYLRR